MAAESEFGTTKTDKARIRPNQDSQDQNSSQLSQSRPEFGTIKTVKALFRPEAPSGSASKVEGGEKRMAAESEAVKEVFVESESTLVISPEATACRSACAVVPRRARI